MPSQRDLLLEDVLSEVLMQDPLPNGARLAELCALYPKQKEEILAFFEAWSAQLEMDAGDDGADAAYSASLSERGVAQALALLVDGAVARGRSKTKSRRVRLSAILRSFGIDKAGFARACGLDEAILVKLDRRCIQPTSDIPESCFARMSAALVQSARPNSADANFHVALAHTIQRAVSGAPLTTDIKPIAERRGKARVAEGAVRRQCLSLAAARNFEPVGLKRRLRRCCSM
jgi:hypothetical protein